MPTFLLGKTLSYYFNGYNFSGISDKYDAEPSTAVLNATTFGPSYHKTAQPGQLQHKITVDGFYTATISPDLSGVYNQIRLALRVDTPGLVVLPGAGTIPAAGDLADLWIATISNSKISSTEDNLVRLQAEFTGKTGLHMGVVIAAEAAYTPTVQTAYYDLGAGFTTGTYAWLVIVQVTAYTSGMGALALESSTDHITWTPRGTLPAITTIDGAALAATTTLDRYIRVNGTGVGTVIVGFAITN
jgi:hypothetical protein